MLAVGSDLAHVPPFGRVGIGLAGAAANVDDLVAGAYQPGDEEGANVAAAADDGDFHGSPIFPNVGVCRIELVTTVRSPRIPWR